MHNQVQAIPTLDNPPVSERLSRAYDPTNFYSRGVGLGRILTCQPPSHMPGLVQTFQARRESLARQQDEIDFGRVSFYMIEKVL
jgi:hypothetical protein